MPIGTEYSNDTIKETLDKIGARFELLDDPVSRCVSDLMKDRGLVPGADKALHTYFCSGLDVLYLGNYRLSKSS